MVNTRAMTRKNITKDRKEKENEKEEPTEKYNQTNMYETFRPSETTTHSTHSEVLHDSSHFFV